MVLRAPGPLAATSTRARAALLAVALLVAAPARGGEVVKVTGTGSALGVLARVARAYERANPGATIRLLPSLGTSGSIKAVAGGAIDLGLAGRTLTEQERALGLTSVPVARSPFVFVAGPKSGVTAIGMRELVRIYAGEQRTWPGGERVRPILRPAGDTDTFYLKSLSPGLAVAYEAALARAGMLVGATNQDSDEIAERTPGSLAVTTLAQLVTEPRELTPLVWEGVAPTLANLAAGHYPLWKPFHAILPTRAPDRVRRFLEFVGSPEARKILLEAGCLPPPFPPTRS